MSKALEDNVDLSYFVKNMVLKYCPVVENRVDSLQDARTNPELDIQISHVDDKSVINFLLGNHTSKKGTGDRIVVEHNVEFEDVRGILDFILQDHGAIDGIIKRGNELEFMFGINWTEESIKGINCGNISLRISFSNDVQRENFYRAFKTYCTQLENKNLVVDSRLLSELRSEFFESCNKEQLLSMFSIMTAEHLAIIVNQKLFGNCSKEDILAVLSKMDEPRLRELLSNIDYKTLLGCINSRDAVRPKRKEPEQRGDHIYSVFYDDNDNEVMRIGFPGSDCWWDFRSARPVVITKDMELYDLLMNLMRQDYDIPSEQTFVPKKTKDELLWYSDCYCNPDDPRSVEAVSRLTIHIVEDVIILQCLNDSFDKIGKTNQLRGVGFGCCGNGSRIAINKKTGHDFGYDFILKVNNPLQKKKKSNLTKKPKKNAQNKEEQKNM